jgi:hypothetical protein
MTNSQKKLVEKTLKVIGYLFIFFGIFYIGLAILNEKPEALFYALIFFVVGGVPLWIRSFLKAGRKC